MAVSFPSPLSKPERLTMSTPLHSPTRDPPSKKRRVEGHSNLSLDAVKVRWFSPTNLPWSPPFLLFSGSKVE